jgi:DNA polymerase-3 subunit alpha
MNNYIPYHIHSDLSNGVTNIDSVTKFKEYIEVAKENGIKAFAFSEHGNLFEWWHKKCAIEAAGMKYIHAIEAYITESLAEKVRDNYHCVLLAKNYDGFKELNSLITKSFCRDDNHFYYVPRISLDELENTSENIIVTTACLGGVLYKGNDDVKGRYLGFIKSNKDRCFLEVQHHLDSQQVEYNKYLYNLSQQFGIRLIAGTDTHALNSEHIDGRRILQKAKSVNFPDESNWDLTFKTYDDLCDAYRKQNSLPQSVFEEAIDNTNLLNDFVEQYDISKEHKYPKIYNDPANKFIDDIYHKLETHPYIQHIRPQYY